MNFVKFDLTAAQVNAIDAAAITVKTLKTNTSLARVPVRFTIMKAAGTAYTVGADAKIEVKDSGGQVLFSLAAAGFLDQATAQGRTMGPATSGMAFKSGGVTTFTISASGSIASGTGGVSARIFFDEESVLW